MAFPEVHLSRPAVLVPETVVDNRAVISKVKDNFRGSAEEWEPIERGIGYVLGKCGTEVRHIETDISVSPGQFAARAVNRVLAETGLDASDVGMLVYGGIARFNFEPATAAEVCGHIGARPLHAFDVTCACAGLIEALHTVTAYFALHPGLNTAVICAGEVFRNHIDFDIQNVSELPVKVAGLTLGNAAAAFVVSRAPLAAGSARLENIRHTTLPENWELCYAPVDGHFTSRSKELFALSVTVAPEIENLLSEIGWTAQEIDHYAVHQPSVAILNEVFDAVDAKQSSRVSTHHLYANTASTAWALALDHRLREGTVRAGDKLVLASAAAGFTIGTAALTWDGQER